MSMPGPATPWEAEEDAVSERAAEFLAQKRCGVWGAAEQAALDAWLKDSVLHEVAWLRVQGIAARADRLAVVNAFELKRSQRIGEGKPNRRRFMIPLLAAASLALFAALGFPFMSSMMQPPDRTYSTEVGGRSLLKFADGTVVDLNTDTVVRFHMTNKERTVWLEKGEAWFHVAHNAANPFTVFVNRHRITDLGTEFLVRSSTDTLKVALLNGRASLSAEGAPVAMLVPGDEAVATSVSMSLTRKTPQELADELAWRRGMLVFRNTRLADAVREVNRYNTIKLVVADPSIADLKVTGEIRNDNFEDFIEIAQSMMRLHADRRGEDILLSRNLATKTKRAAAAKHEP